MAQGLALAHDLPLIPVSSLAVMAQTAYRQCEAEHILVGLDARMNEVYFGEYCVVNGLVQAVNEDFLSPPAAIKFPREVDLAVGPAFDTYQEDFKELPKDLKLNAEFYPDAQDLVALAVKQFEEQGGGVSAEQLEMAYLRGSSAWQSQNKA